MERRLAAILAADVVGYSRLMHEDDTATFERLSALRTGVVEPAIERYRGRVVKVMGDGLLAEFPSVVEAVRCALALQGELARHEAALPRDRRIEMRIGINLGDVIVDGADIYGDGVNVAARLEALAEPGGICVSRSVVSHVRNQIDAAFDDLGERRVRNIPRPVHVYRVSAATPGARAQRPGGRRPLRSLAFAAAAASLAALAFVLWPGRDAGFAPASPERMALPLPDAPSLTVVPFAGASGTDAADGADGLAESLLAEAVRKLGTVKGLFVIAARTSLELAEGGTEVREVAETLGVRHVLDGRFERLGDGVAATAWLSDALAGERVWSGSFDLAPGETMRFPGALAAAVTEALGAPPDPGGRTTLERPPTAILEAWRLHLRAVRQRAEGTAAANAAARETWSRAVQRDPDFALAWAMIGWTRWADAWFGWTPEPARSLERARQGALRALETGRDDAEAQALLGAVALMTKDHANAVAHAEKAVAQAPGDADAHARLAISLNFAGAPGRARGMVERAMRLNPRFPAWYLFPLAEAQRLEGHPEAAIGTAREHLRRSDDLHARVRLAIYSVQAGKTEPARAEIARVLVERPKYTIASWHQARLFADAARTEADLSALEEAGLPAIVSFECLMRDQCP